MLHPVVAVLEVKGSGLDAAFFGVEVRGWLSYRLWLTLAVILGFHGGTKLYRGSESTVKCHLYPLETTESEHVCVFLSVLSELLSQLYSIPTWMALQQLNWFHQMRVIDHESLMNSILPMRLIDHKSCGLHVDSHDVLRWLTMRILWYRCSQFFAILFAKHSIYNLSHNYRNQIRVKENHFPTPTE